MKPERLIKMPSNKEREEAENERAKFVKDRRSNLESKVYQAFIGANEIKNNPTRYGTIATESADRGYSEFLRSGEANEIRGELYDAKKKEQRELGIAQEPEITDYEIAKAVKGIIEQSMAVIPLGMLEESVKNVAKDLKIKIPKKFRDMTYEEFTKRAIESGAVDKERGLDPDKLSESDRDYLVMYNTLRSAYDKGAAMEIMRKGYLAKENAIGRQISEKYEPQEKDKK
jgi:hypothetical protein